MSKTPNPMTWSELLRVVLKAEMLFALCNVTYALAYPALWIGDLTLYGTVYPTRERFPYGENPSQAYSLTLNNRRAMLAAHALNQPKPDDEYRVLVAGDSSTWGWFLQADETYTANINAAGLQLEDGRRIVTYNIGYPVMSLTKDLILLHDAQAYQPDMVVWLVSAQSFPHDVQNASPVDLWWDSPYYPDTPPVVPFWERTIIGQRLSLAQWLRHQTWGAAWSATGIDQYIPDDFERTPNDLEDSLAWGVIYAEQVDLTTDNLAFDVLREGVGLFPSIPVIVVNEPIFIADGENSEVRYNSLYPRWAYDAYRGLLQAEADDAAWHYADWWDVMPPDAFSDSPVHLTPEGATQLADRLHTLILTTAEETP
jgi:hypothetical protein